MVGWGGVGEGNQEKNTSPVNVSRSLKRSPCLGLFKDLFRIEEYAVYYADRQ